MTRFQIGCLSLAILILSLHSVAQEPSDLQVQLRSATGSNRFQIGEVIPLEAVLSSRTPNRYLEPCELFSDRSFGFPQCRFFSPWSFAITPDRGWVDLTREFPSGPRLGGGPTFEVPNRDLSTQASVFKYVLTSRFRFEEPGEYHVTLKMQVGLDDETTPTPRMGVQRLEVSPHSVNVSREIVLQIVPASAEWQREVVRKGYEAYSAPQPRVSDPPSPERLRYEKAAQALCNLGTPEAARALARLLSQDRREVQSCLLRIPSAAAAIEEMRRLLVDPDVAVRNEFFSVLVGLLSREESRKNDLPMRSQEFVDSERERLSAALERKRGEAKALSLITVLQNPARGKSTPFESGSALPVPPPTIEETVANFDQFPWELQKWVLGDGWEVVRSPLMLPLVRRLAQAGSGPALLRWMELDPEAATAFEREEVVRPVPRFSSYYLRLPDVSLPNQEAQMAANFVALTQWPDQVRAATLLHRYATRAVLPKLLPFIDAKRAEWQCAVQFPVLAYILKVSPKEAEPRVTQALREVNHGPCNSSSFLVDLGFLQPSAVLERSALAQIDAGQQPFARDGAEYLKRYGSAASKPKVWDRLKYWHKQFEARGVERRLKNGTATNDDYVLNELVSALVDAYTAAQAWMISPDEESMLQTLLGKEAMSQVSCQFACNASIAVTSVPGNYSIYGVVNQGWDRKESPMEYLNPQERLRYGVNGYRCADMKALKAKILQFPRGSTFNFAYEFTVRDRAELVEISDFLWSHGYKVRNLQHWSFLREDPMN